MAHPAPSWIPHFAPILPPPVSRLLVRAVALLLLALPGMATPQSATAVPLPREYSFDVDGVLPSADSDTEYVTSGVTITETTAFSVSGGVLRQRTMGQNGRAYYQSSVSSAGFDPTLPLQLEARLQILSITADYSLTVSADDGTNLFTFVLGDSGAEYWDEFSSHTQIYFDVDAGGGFHTYLLESGANDATFRLYQDGVEVGSGTAGPTNGTNSWSFGDTSWGPANDADADWDYVRFDNPLGTFAGPGWAGSATPLAIQPNPTSSGTTVRFDLRRGGRASVRILDSAGRVVRTIREGTLDAGSHSVFWDGRNTSGNRVAAGVYLLNLSTSDGAATGRIIVLH